ncbi:hypothetical protein M1307_00070 [Patescibacteria group bacterium]|nr:hypothetical protein [Patescibacteria group bacterium]
MSSENEVSRRKFLRIAFGTVTSVVAAPIVASCGGTTEKKEAGLEELGLTGIHKIVGIRAVDLAPRPDGKKTVEYQVMFEKNKIDAPGNNKDLQQLLINMTNINLQRAEEEAPSTINFDNLNLNDVSTTYGVQKLIDNQTDGLDQGKPIVTIKISPRDLPNLLYNPNSATK